MPALGIDREEIKNHIDDLAARANQCGRCERATTNAIADIARLARQVYDLHAALRAERLRSANLEAAIRAALGAHDDGESDPLVYLRDETGGSTGGAYGA